MFALIVASIRHRVAALLAVVVAAGLGSALIVMCGAMFETGIRLSSPPERLAGADLVVIGDPSYTMLDANGEPTTDLRPFPERRRLPSAAVDQATRIDGVSHAVPIQFYDTLIHGASEVITLTSQNWAAARVSGLPLPTDAGPDSGAVVLSARAAEQLGTAPGDTITLTVAGLGQPSTAQIEDVIGGPGDAATVFLSEQDTTGQTIDAVGVLLDSGADEGMVRDALVSTLGDVRVLAGDGRGAAEDPAVFASRTPTIVIGAVSGGIVLTVLATVVSGIVALAVRQRDREISLMRALGATGRQVRTLLVGEATIAGVVGAIIGLAPGGPLAHALYAVMRAGTVVPAGLELRLGLIPLGIALAITSLTVWLTAQFAARPARRSRPIDALREAELPHATTGVTRWIVGVLFALGAIALAIITCLMPPALVSATAGPAVLAGAISAALLAPAHLGLGLILLRPLTGRAGIRGLARVNVQSLIAPFATVTAAAALVVGIGAGNLISQSMLTTTAARAQVSTLAAPAAVTGPPSAILHIKASLAELPDVAAVSAFVTSGGWIEHPHDPSHPDRPWSLRGVDGLHAHKVLHNRLVTGDFADLTGQSIALPARTADELGVTVGDAVRFRFGDGAAETLRVAATYDDLDGYEHLILPADLLTVHTTARTPRTLLITPIEGTSNEALLATLRDAVAGDAALTVTNRDTFDTTLQQGLNITALINALMLLVALAYALIANTNTIAVTILGRRRELALLRLAGATHRQIRTMLRAETGIAAGTGIGIGIIVACAAILPTAIVTAANPLAPHALAIFAALVVAATVTTLPITGLAARRALRQRPVDTIT